METTGLGAQVSPRLSVGLTATLAAEDGLRSQDLRRRAFSAPSRRQIAIEPGFIVLPATRRLRPASIR